MARQANERQHDIDDGLPLIAAGCRSFTMFSSDTHLEYRIFVYVPDEAPPPSGFPVLCVLDGNADFLMVTETVRRAGRRPSATGIPPSIVVGLGYPNASAYDPERRYFDFTRGPPADATQADSRYKYGGGESFARFLSQQLLPYVSQHFSARRDRRILLGHSLAAFFVLDVLANHPSLFSGYIGLSPSVWWDRAALSQALKRYEGDPAPVAAYLGVGRWEEEFAPWQSVGNDRDDYADLRRQRRMIENARQISQEIKSAFGERARVTFEIGEDEDHATIIPTLLCRALRFTLQPAIG
ncbi:MAG: alpha/beta hydrolase-fold protein [Rhizobium sp.]